jgi:tetratricopeptide (TPR) repeat protein
MVFWSASAAAQNPQWAESTKLANQLRNQGRYLEAEKSYQAAIAEAEKFGESTPQLAGSLSGLGAVFADQAKYAEAEGLYRRAAAISKLLARKHRFGNGLGGLRLLR